MTGPKSYQMQAFSKGINLFVSMLLQSAEGLFCRLSALHLLSCSLNHLADNIQLSAQEFVSVERASLFQR